MSFGNPGGSQNLAKMGREKKPISISSILQTVFNDIERHGVEKEAYTKGVMCLIYKKKNKMKIETIGQ